MDRIVSDKLSTVVARLETVLQRQNELESRVDHFIHHNYNNTPADPIQETVTNHSHPMPDPAPPQIAPPIGDLYLERMAVEHERFSSDLTSTIHSMLINWENRQHWAVMSECCKLRDEMQSIRLLVQTLLERHSPTRSSLLSSLASKPEGRDCGICSTSCLNIFVASSQASSSSRQHEASNSRPGQQKLGLKL